LKGTGYISNILCNQEFFIFIIKLEYHGLLGFTLWKMKPCRSYYIDTCPLLVAH
jgi:hypothetical protein